MSKIKAYGHNGNLWNVNELKDKITTVIFSNKKRKGAVAGPKTGREL